MKKKILFILFAVLLICGMSASVYANDTVLVPEIGETIVYPIAPVEPDEEEKEIILPITPIVPIYPDNVEETPIPGDMNGDGTVDKEDSDLLAKYFAGWPISAKDINFKAGDVNGDGKVTRAEAMKLSRKEAGWSPIALGDDFTEFYIQYVDDETNDIIPLSEVFLLDYSACVLIDKIINDKEYMDFVYSDTEYIIGSDIGNGAAGTDDRITIVDNKKIHFKNVLIQKNGLYYIGYDAGSVDKYWVVPSRFQYSDFYVNTSGEICLDIRLKKTNRNLSINFINGETNESINISQIFTDNRTYSDLIDGIELDNDIYSGYISTGHDNIRIIDDQYLYIPDVPLIENGRYCIRFDYYINRDENQPHEFWIPVNKYIVPEHDFLVDEFGNGHITVKLYQHDKEFTLNANLVYYDNNGNLVPLKMAKIWIENQDSENSTEYFCSVDNGKLILDFYFSGNETISYNSLPAGEYNLVIGSGDMDENGFYCLDSVEFNMDNNTDLGTIILRRIAYISGDIIDVNTGRGISGCRVIIRDAESSFGIVSIEDSYGYYGQFTALLTKGRYEATIKKSGYIEKIVPFEVNGTTKLGEITLVPIN
ncbi:MAG: hypothetical protein E7579_09820 [Ruminococcaceae bacterium]|nr:hypothetical protein [Oscillospiraceae bacterium]